MTDETDISRELAVYNEQRAQKVIAALERHAMSGYYAAGRDEALDIVLALIPPDVVVARGDSISLDQIGFPEAIKKRSQNKVIDPFQFVEGGFKDKPEARRQMMLETFTADVLVTGSNAVTMDGKLVNVDGHGNRVSAMIFGPAKVILVVGVNKIVKNVDEALERIRRYAAPLNARRHYMKHGSENFADLPCVKTGSCADCRKDWRICNYTTIIEGAMPSHKGRINVVLVGEALGL